MTIKRIDRQACRVLRLAINDALATISEQHGIDFTATNASYNDNTVTFKVECTLTGVDKAQEDFNAACFLFRLEEDAYGKRFNWGGKEYTLCGLKPNSPKYPILGMLNGSRYKLPRAAINSLCAPAQATPQLRVL